MKPEETENGKSQMAAPIDLKHSACTLDNRETSNGYAYVFGVQLYSSELAATNSDQPTEYRTWISQLVHISAMCC